MTDVSVMRVGSARPLAKVGGLTFIKGPSRKHLGILAHCAALSSFLFAPRGLVHSMPYYPFYRGQRSLWVRPSVRPTQIKGNSRGAGKGSPYLGSHLGRGEGYLRQLPIYPD